MKLDAVNGGEMPGLVGGVCVYQLCRVQSQRNGGITRILVTPRHRPSV